MKTEKTLSVISLVVSICAICLCLISLFKGNQKSDNNVENVLDTLPALAESTVPRLAYINSDTLMARYDMVTKMTAEMDAKMKSLQKDFDKKKNQFQKDVEYFQTQVELGSLSEQSSQEIYQKLMERQQELYDLQENYANQVAELEQKNLQTVYDKVTNYLSRVNENNKYYDFIFINTGIINVNNAYDLLNIFLFLSLITSFTACNQKAGSNSIMPADSMVVIMKDLYIVEGIGATNAVPGVTKEELYDEYFKVNGLDRERFEKSLEYYYKNEPKMLNEKINARVVDSLQSIN